MHTWPRVLVIGLKIFHARDGKLDRHVHAPHLLRYSNAPCYRLRAFIEHLGAMKQGHYITCTRTDNDTWFWHSDADQPREMSLAEVDARKPYCLFYERQV